MPRAENEWPIARTQWTKYYFHSGTGTFRPEPQGNERAKTYDALGDGLIYISPPFAEETEITGPVAAKMFISSDTEDADLFLTLRVFTPDMTEIVYRGANDPHTPVAIGWLRASHRKLDEALTLPYRPYHTHDEIQPLTPGEIYELDIEIWPTSIVIPREYRLAISVRGRDYVWPGYEPSAPKISGRVYYGVGPFKHDLKEDRPTELFGGKVTLHTGPSYPSHVLLPVIPPKG